MSLSRIILNVLTHITRFGERGSIGDSERHLERARERLREQRLARTGWTEQHDVTLRKLDIAFRGFFTHADALVVVIYGDRKRLLGFFLTDHVLGKLFVELFGRGQIGEHVGMFRRAFLDARHKLVAEHLIERF